MLQIRPPPDEEGARGPCCDRGGLKGSLVTGQRSCDHGKGAKTICLWISACFSRGAMFAGDCFCGFERDDGMEMLSFVTGVMMAGLIDPERLLVGDEIAHQLLTTLSRMQGKEIRSRCKGYAFASSSFLPRHISASSERGFLTSLHLTPFSPLFHIPGLQNT